VKLVRYSVKKGDKNRINPRVFPFDPRGAQSPIYKGRKYSIFNNVGRFFDNEVLPVNLRSSSGRIGGYKENNKSPNNWRAPVFK